jgi:hypothetical protein
MLRYADSCRSTGVLGDYCVCYHHYAETVTHIHILFSSTLVTAFGPGLLLIYSQFHSGAEEEHEAPRSRFCDERPFGVK